MKFRAGFISNSSSSSFIIAIPKGMDINLENMFYVVFPETMKLKKDIDNKLFRCFGNKDISAIQATQIIVRDLKFKEPNDIDKLKEVLNGYINKRSMSAELLEKVGMPPTYPDNYWPLLIEEARIVLNEYDLKYNDWCEKMLNVFMEYNKNCDIYELEYSDNEGSFINAAMEHGGVFDEMINNGSAIMVNNH
ncbi:MAG: hypothetical protein QXG00_08340 [Candidatus Woesearchaeota archaeon]